MHRTFGAARIGSPQREPITLDFGLYGEDRFTVVPEPSLGDCFELYDAPDSTPGNDLEVARYWARFLRTMIAPDERPRFDEVLRRIPATQASVIIEAGVWVTEQVTGFPTAPPEGSSSGRRTTGTSSRPKPAGRRRSGR